MRSDSYPSRSKAGAGQFVLAQLRFEVLVQHARELITRRHLRSVAQERGLHGDQLRAARYRSGLFSRPCEAAGRMLHFAAVRGRNGRL